MTILRKNDRVEKVTNGKKRMSGIKMGGLFYDLGKMAGPFARKAKWVWQYTAGSEEDTIKAEKTVGMDLAWEVRRNLEIDGDPRVLRILGEIGSHLSGCVANRQRSFQFECVKGGQPNAFALPGGFIFVARSLLELCGQDRDEIAFVFGHEMGHVIRGHAMERIVTASAASVFSRLGQSKGVLGGLVGKIGMQLLTSAYSQQQELEADRLAVRLAHAAGYDPQAAVRLLIRLAQQNQARQTTGGQAIESSGLGNYFSSHPATDTRIANIKNLLRQLAT